MGELIKTYLQSKIDNMKKTLEELGFIHKYEKEAVKSALCYILTLLICFYVAKEVHNIKIIIYNTINYLSSKENIYIAKLYVIFSLAITWFIGSIFYLYYIIVNKRLRHRINSIDSIYHKMIQIFIKIVLITTISLIGIILIQNTTLEALYFKHINLGISGLGLILLSLFCVGFYYKLVRK